MFFPGFPGAISGTGAAKLWEKSGKIVNHPLAPPKSAGKLSRHRNQSGTGQRSPLCESWDIATTGEVPSTWVWGREECDPHAILSSSPQSACSCPRGSARASRDAQAWGEMQGRAGRGTGGWQRRGGLPGGDGGYGGKNGV